MNTFGQKPLFALLVGGALGGLLGSALGHWAVVAIIRWIPQADLWFKGAHGPPFFNLLVNTSIFYAGLGAGLGRKPSKLRSALWGFGTAFLSILLPMALATRIFSWGEGPSAQETLAWFYLILGVYTAASIFAVWILGARWTGASGWKSGCGAVFGLLVGYLAGLGLTRLAPELRSFFPGGFLPPLASLADGIITGAAVGCGIALTTKIPQLLRDPRNIGEGPVEPPAAGRGCWVGSAGRGKS